MTVVVIAEDALMPAGDVTEVPRRGLPTTDLAATSMSADASDVPCANVSTTSGTPGVPATGATASRVPAARAPAAVSHAERDASVQGEREDDGEAKGERVTTGRRQRPLNRRELHGESLVASLARVKGGERFATGLAPAIRGRGRPRGVAWPRLMRLSLTRLGLVGRGNATSSPESAPPTGWRLRRDWLW